MVVTRRQQAAENAARLAQQAAAHSQSPQERAPSPIEKNTTSQAQQAIASAAQAREGVHTRRMVREEQEQASPRSQSPQERAPSSREEVTTPIAQETTPQRADEQERIEDQPFTSQVSQDSEVSFNAPEEVTNAPEEVANDAEEVANDAMSIASSDVADAEEINPAEEMDQQSSNPIEESSPRQVSWISRVADSISNSWLGQQIKKICSYVLSFFRSNKVEEDKVEEENLDKNNPSLVPNDFRETYLEELIQSYKNQHEILSTQDLNDYQLKEVEDKLFDLYSYSKLGERITRGRIANAFGFRSCLPRQNNKA